MPPKVRRARRTPHIVMKCKLKNYRPKLSTISESPAPSPASTIINGCEDIGAAGPSEATNRPVASVPINTIEKKLIKETAPVDFERWLQNIPKAQSQPSNSQPKPSPPSRRKRRLEEAANRARTKRTRTDDGPSTENLSLESRLREALTELQEDDDNRSSTTSDNSNDDMDEFTIIDLNRPRRPRT